MQYKDIKLRKGDVDSSQLLYARLTFYCYLECKHRFRSRLSPVTCLSNGASYYAIKSAVLFTSCPRYFTSKYNVRTRTNTDPHSVDTRKLYRVEDPLRERIQTSSIYIEKASWRLRHPASSFNKSERTCRTCETGDRTKCDM